MQSRSFLASCCFSPPISPPANTPSRPATNQPIRWPPAFAWIAIIPPRKEDKPITLSRVPFGFALMVVAGLLSGLLGIGSGAFKVLAMDQAMRLPFKVSTTTSNFMIGVTAAASAGIYLHRGYIDPRIAMPVMLGVVPGSILGTLVLVRVNPGKLRLLFALVIVALGLEMIYKAATGGF